MSLKNRLARLRGAGLGTPKVEETERLARAFRALSEEHRAVLVRSQIDGASAAEIAIELGRSPEAVRKLVARALARLSAELEPPSDPTVPSERLTRT